jgi:anti-sigma B factor antagonist
MHVTISSEAGITRAEVQGSIDGQTVPQVREELRPAMEKAEKLILDLSRVDFLSSAGLRLLLLLYREFTAKNGKLVLVGVSPEIRAVMSHTGFLKFFTLADTPQEALRQVE